MRELGVRELKASLSEVLRSVRAGEAVRVTVRGRPVADIVPTGSTAPDSGLRELAASGRLSLPSQPLPKEAPPLAETQVSASALVLAEREARR